MTDRELRIIKHAETAIIKDIKKYQTRHTDDFDTEDYAWLVGQWRGIMNLMQALKIPTQNDYDFNDPEIVRPEVEI